MKRAVPWVGRLFLNAPNKGESNAERRLKDNPPSLTISLFGEVLR